MGAANPFLVNLAALRPGAGGRHHVVRAGRLEGLAVTSSAVPDDAEVVVDAMLDIVAGGVVVAGTVASSWIGECRRCLRRVEGPLVAEVREVYAPPSRTADREEDGDDTYPLIGDVLDLAPLARDALLLDLPLAPLCGTECAGLCPTCGADLAEAACGCPTPGSHPAWAALDVLAPKSEG